jgi:hypothetical protein
LPYTAGGAFSRPANVSEKLLQFENISIFATLNPKKIQWHRNAHISPRKEKEEISTVSVNVCLLPTGAE